MKINTSTIACFIIGLGLALSLGFASAEKKWDEPSGGPLYQVSPPVHSGSTAQVKEGNLQVDGTFSSEASSLFDQNVYIKTKMIGGLPGAPKDLRIGGTYNSTNYTVATMVNGSVAVKNTIGSSDIISATPQRLCGNAEGKVVLCTATTQSQIVMGSVSNTTTSQLACSTLSSSARPYYINKSLPLSSPLTGTYIYENSAMTTPVNGNSKWYALLYQTSQGSRTYAVQIDTDGKVITSVGC